MTKILLIEDNEFNRDLTVRFLGRFDYEVTVAVDGLDGLQRVRADYENIDVILMDMNLPEIDGWELTRQLKSDAMTKHVPVIALTAHAMVGDREKALAAGCDDYASKPIDFKKLVEKIKKLCNKVHLQDRIETVVTHC